jgi:hypothetical protein
LFNVYGYCMCCCSSAVIEALNRVDGREARGRILNGHSVPEVKYGDDWHMFDASLLTYFPRPRDGVAASVEEISHAVRDWYAQHPGCRGNAAKLDQIMRADGWTGWKSQGPALLAHCPYYQLGWFPARTHGWDATMVEYDRQCEVYEYGYEIGHRAVFSLRPGESFVREAGNRGLHVNMLETKEIDCLRGKAPENDLVYLNDFLRGYRGGIVGNGYHRYAPDLSAVGLADGAEVYENLVTGSSPALHLREGGKPGVATIPLASPYVYLGGRLTLKAVRRSEADSVTLFLSTNNGRTFQPLWKADKVGKSEAVIDLQPRICRRYAYWLKIMLESATPTGAGLEVIAIENDVQHAPRTLPWLGKGINTITVAADGDTTLATRTVACRITPEPHFSKNETTASMGVIFDNLRMDDGSCWWKDGVGTMTVPITTPGELRALRFSTQFRARGPKDAIGVEVSYDGGRSWQKITRFVGPTAGRTEYVRWSKIPSGKMNAMLRFELSGNNTVGILSFRIDADFSDPRAARTFLPFVVVHRWLENGKEKSHREAIHHLPTTYSVQTDADPEMVSVSYDMPAKP